jgi:hypothetical protein
VERSGGGRPHGPRPLTSRTYADDFDQVKELGRLDSTSRTPEQTLQARFWTDHDIRRGTTGCCASPRPEG